MKGKKRFWEAAFAAKQAAMGWKSKEKTKQQEAQDLIEDAWKAQEI